MVEDSEEKPMSGLDLEQYCALIGRRRSHILISLFMGWLLVCGAGWILPSAYKSGTLILVEQPSMPKDYVVPNISDDIQNRLQSITQQILSRTRLLRIIGELNLYARERNRFTSDEVVERMRKDISIELVRDERSRELTAFNVYYSSRDPHIAQRVTSELTSLFINENLEVRQQQSEETTRFLESQLEEARKTLADQEQKVREFKDQHPGELPAQLGTNLQILSGLQSQLQKEEDALNTANQQTAYLQSLLGQYDAGRGSGDDPKSQRLLALSKLKAQLADLRSLYTDRHPDVRRVKEQVAEIEAAGDSETTHPVNSSAKTGAHAGTISGENADLRRSSPLVQLEGQLRANQVEIRNRNLAIATMQAKINEYQSRLSQEPVVEQQFAELSRGYDQSKEIYDDLLKKKNQSAMATSLELRQQGEHFRVIDPPSLPVKPEFPNHLKLCALGLGVGLALAGAVAGGAEIMDDRLHSGKALKGLLPVAVLAEVPVVVTLEEEEAERKNMKMAWASTGLVFATISVGFALSYLRG
jgi:polysaccharide chain length determinant protein (PEP-CTERM system associated)